MARPNPLDLTVCPTEESGGVSVEDCATTEIRLLILVWAFDAVPGPGTNLSHDNRADQNAVKSCVPSSNI